MSKGNQVRGAKHHAAKFTEAKVRTIRRLARLGWSLSVIHKCYPFASKVAVWNIIHRKSWRHIPEES